jgi:hypothetical protein
MSVEEVKEEEEEGEGDKNAQLNDNERSETTQGLRG